MSAKVVNPDLIKREVKAPLLTPKVRLLAKSNFYLAIPHEKVLKSLKFMF